jgi:isoleucyl-tRNA synthetase
LSNFYLDVAKDRLYISGADGFRRRSCQTVLAVALENLAKAIAPVLCHTAEDIWQNIPYSPPHKSVFEAGWVTLEKSWEKPELGSLWQQLRQIRADVNQVIEQARKDKMVGASLDAKVLLFVGDETLRQKLKVMNPSIKGLQDESESNEKIEGINGTHQITVNGNLQTQEIVSQGISKDLQEILEANPKTQFVIPEQIAQLSPSIAGNLLSQAIATLANSQQAIRDDNLKAQNNASEKRLQSQEKVLDANLKSAELTIHEITHLQPETQTQSSPSNGVDELRYLFICSQVEVLESSEPLQGLKYTLQTDDLGIGVVKADGEKCDRCWNYSVHIGESKEDPTICERCVEALAGTF